MAYWILDGPIRASNPLNNSAGVIDRESEREKLLLKNNDSIEQRVYFELRSNLILFLKHKINLQ